MKFVFIVTYGRTGSTALQMALNTLPGYCIRGENGGVLEHLAAATSAIKLAQTDPSRKTTDVRNPWYGIEHVDVEGFRSAIAEAFVKEVLRPDPETRVLGFKEIRFVHLTDEAFHRQLDFCVRAFDPRFIFLTRDPEVAAQSGMWSDSLGARKKLENARDRLVAAHERYDSYLIDHADFSDNPEGIVPLVKWLDEDPTSVVASLSQKLTHLQSLTERSVGQKFKGKIRRALGNLRQSGPG